VHVERKLATVLFIDLVDSTGLVSASDPEVVRRRVNLFFDRISRCVEAHGGIVEKFAGDAVMAAFGIPLAHEDDAERAVRAGIEMLQAVEELGLEARIGVEAGEVVADESDSTFATGEAVNLAARLQQTAGPGEILIGPAAHGLTVGRLDVEEMGPMVLRGREDPVWTWRVLSASTNGHVPLRSTAPFVGREAELELLENTWDRALRNKRAHMFTVYGEPGVGKSRLSAEFSASLEGATVLKGRALPYGEGITYWPLAEMVKAAAGISDDDPVAEAIQKLRDCCEDEAVADLLALASGVLAAVEAERSQQEIAWAAREFVEQLAAVQPLVMIFEDIHWAEEPLLELIEHLATWVREAPLLLFCLARPELLDVRPGWGGGRVRATAIELEPLVPAESEELVDALLEDGALDPELRAAVLEKTEGNPLFVEETVRMLAESGGDSVPERIPDSLQALIAARIDRLPPAEKSLIQRAAVVGRVFWAGALASLARDLDGADVSRLLDDLLLRDLVLPEVRSSISGERAYRFKHVLIREVAYSGLSKSVRAEQHERFAEWLQERAPEELLEIRAYHLDHAAQLIAELDGAAPQELASEAAAALEEAGRRALAREANRSARKLLLRALELEPTLERRFQAARAAWRLSDLPALSREMRGVAEEAAAAGDRQIEGKALTALAEVALLREGNAGRAEELAERAIAVLDPDLRFDALRVRATIAWWHGALSDQERYAKEALELARRLARKDLEAKATQELAKAYHAAMKLDEAAEMVDRALELAEESGSVVARAGALDVSGHFHMHRKEFDEAKAAFSQARDLYAEIGDAWMLGRMLNELSWVAMERGDFDEAEPYLREAMRVLKPLEDRGTLCESQRGLAQVLIAKGRLEEAERLALEAIETVGSGDVSSRATTTMTLGRVRAAQGRDEEAEQLLREAVAVAEPTELAGLQLWLLSTLDEFLRKRDRADEAVAERVAELSPVAALGSAYASRIERIA
jgi:class 3 adenylate cyclase/tetratricopeptide (TPR) repeat protein